MSHLSEVIAEERAACASYLRRSAKGQREQAARLRADTSQNEPDALLWEARATAYTDAADAIEAGRHWS